ncbi:MAG: hypothetical protein COW01_16445 [Bdellovibrionales bacterium CG12_big_fil_rev_8_21_14_0_65_38_15]|nr:MAG: hypothetical protein COW79_00465 [Bdellovibrionales bacterium CG22_combo_CG10-13_8_21_14_all_38_13]PIQ52292.1 MAG: hypothetical protein COW01_16445 [Bdellovibrionales bacterium CG12_big_fil_rev_8_21_14_0_65_38_15]PIR29821.1 MAG: hypothetical protein COV38_08910 [Bdellovibrionales bacterium CG11_big_fil_rev_8_21_14_0_20_38_13]
MLIYYDTSLQRFNMVSLVLIWLFFTGFFVVAYFKKDISFIDVGWGPAFSWLFFSFALTSFNQLGWLQYLVAALVFAWSLRLAIYLHGRNKKKGVDPRYQELSKDWKGHYWINAYFRVYMVQMLLCLIVAAPIIVVMLSSESAIDLISIIGGIIAISGLVTESVADSQMATFQKMTPKPGKFCRIGLWKYSRHPNYFGEIVFWFGVAIVALSAQHGYLGLIGPVFLTFLLLKVSGVPMLENKYKNHPEWPAYESQTRVLVPFPR